MNPGPSQNWVALLESRRSLVIGGIVLVSFTVLLVSSLRNPFAFDSFWHLQMGKDWIVNGLSPWIDHYSFTYGGKEISNPPVMFQALLHYSVSQFGLRTGFWLVKLGSFILVLGAAFVLLKKLNAPAVIYAIVLPAITFMLQLRVLVRPELISYVLTVVALMLYFRADRKISARQVLPMVLLILVWTNYHRTSIVGFVIFSGYFLDCAFAQYHSRLPFATWAKWLFWGLALLAAGFVNPAWSHPILESFAFSPDWGYLISEYKHDPKMLGLAGIYAMGLIALIMPTLAFLQRKYGFLLIWAVMIYASISVPRLIAVSGIVIVLLLARLLVAKNFQLLIQASNRKMKVVAGVLCLAVFSATLFSNLERARHFMEENRKTMTRYPQALVEYMVEQKMQGRVFNSYAIGGYLINRLSPDIQVYIDGRTDILYPVEHMKWYSAVTRSPEELQSELLKLNVNQIVWTHKSYEFHDILMDIGEFDLEFMDATHALYVRGRGNFPLLGQLISQPACWRSELSGQILGEGQLMEEILPYYSRLFPFVNLLLEYQQADDKPTFLNSFNEKENWLDEMFRFVGFRQIEAGQNSYAIEMFSSIKDRRAQDYLATATAALKDENFQILAQVLNEFSSKSWQHVNDRDLQILYQLYKNLAEFRVLTSFESLSMNNLHNVLMEDAISDLSFELNVSSFCPSTAISHL